MHKIRSADVTICIPENGRAGGWPEEISHPGRERHILAMAAAAAAFPEPFRRYAVLGLLRERFRQTIGDATTGRPVEPSCRGAEVFFAAYGDVTGRAFWRAWLFPGNATADWLASLLAVHVSRSEAEFEHVCKMLAAALTPLTGRPALEMAEHLAANPDTARYMPASLAEFLADAPPTPPAAAPGTPRKRRTGPRAVERTRVVDAMGDALRSGVDVFAEKHIALAARFGAKRTTCREALRVLEAEHRPAGVAGRQTPVNGK